MMGQSKTRVLGVTVLVAMFAAGGLTGAVLQRSATAANTPEKRLPAQRGPSLFETLKLTEAQQARVCTILKQKAAQMSPHEVAVQSVWKEHGPAMKAIIESTYAQVDSLLTPEQRAAKDRFRQDRQKYYGSRDNTKDKPKPGTPGEGARPQGGRDGDHGRDRGNPLGVTCPGMEQYDRGGRSRGGAPSNGRDSAGKRDSGVMAPRPVDDRISPTHEA